MSLASLWRIGAVRPFCEAETHRSDSDCYSLNAVGIPLPFRASGSRKAEVVEDVNPAPVVLLSVQQIEHYFIAANCLCVRISSSIPLLPSLNARKLGLG